MPMHISAHKVNMGGIEIQFFILEHKMVSFCHAVDLAVAWQNVKGLSSIKWFIRQQIILKWPLECSMLTSPFHICSLIESYVGTLVGTYDNIAQYYIHHLHILQMHFSYSTKVQIF